MTTEWNDELKMVSYDAVFRRWPQAYNYLAPIIAPQIAKEMNETYDEATTNVTDLFQRKAAGEICEIAMQYCTGDHEQYSSYGQCYDFLAVQTPCGNPWEGGSNTGICRYIHRNMVPYLPQIHCEHFVDFVLRQTSDEFKLLTVGNQRNTVTYFFNTSYTTLALGLQLYSTPALAHAYSSAGIDSIVIPASVISALYLFEVIHRLQTRASLLARHCCSILQPSLSGIPDGLVSSQATTEQFIFVGLFMYRLKYNPKIVRQVLRFDAVQSLFVKFVFAVYLLVEHSLKLVQFHQIGTDVYFSVIVYGIGILLLATQVYGSWAIWAISLKLTAQLKANSDGTQSCPATPAAAVGGFFRLEDNEAMRKLIQREQMEKMDVRDGGFDRDAVEP
ncbi:hypothetical protein JCM1841_003942 [Sporobolomyces salmonicolor]